MANRATKSGINAEMQKKLEASYSVEDEAKVRGWMEQVTGEEVGKEFFPFLKDGSFLCRLLNKLQEGIVPAKFEKPSTAHFPQIDTIGAFLEGCKKYGMTEKDLFVTVDLHEETNRNMVLATLIALGRQAQKKGYEGPTIGPKEAQPNPREHDEQKLKEGRNVIGLQMGTNQVASAAGMTPYGQGRQIYDPKAQ